MDGSTILFLILVVVGPLAMVWMHAGGHGGHGGGGHGGGGHGGQGAGGGCGGGHSHSPRKSDPAEPKTEAPAGHGGH